MIRVSVIGAGGMGACHARNIAQLAGAEVAWVADPMEEVGRALADEVGAAWTADGQQALADCDGVVIACPDRFHVDYVLGAIGRELPTLCEKPLTVDLGDAEKILECESALGRRLVQVGFMRTYDERHVQVRDALGSLGVVHHVRCVHRNTPTEPRQLERVLLESVIHDIHTVRWLSGCDITEVSTVTINGGDGVRFVVLTCRLAGGGVATIEFDDGAAGYEVSVEVSAERGNVVASAPHRPLVRADGAVGSVIGDDWFAPFLATYRIEVEAWLDSVDSGVAVGPTVWDGYAAQAVAAAAAASDRSRRPEAVVLAPKSTLYREDMS